MKWFLLYKINKPNNKISSYKWISEDKIDIKKFDISFLSENEKSTKSTPQNSSSDSKNDNENLIIQIQNDAYKKVEKQFVENEKLRDQLEKQTKENEKLKEKLLEHVKYINSQDEKFKTYSELTRKFKIEFHKLEDKLKDDKSKFSKIIQ